MKKSGFYRNRNFTVQRFRCLRCAHTFSERQPLDGLRVDFDKAAQVVRLLVEGVGIRAISRFTGLHQATVLSVLELGGRKAAAIHNRLVRNVTTESLQFDELWAYVGAKQANVTPLDTERGDQYTFLAIDRRTKLVLSHFTVKRNDESTDSFVEDLASRVAGRVQITCDGWQAYPDAIRSRLLYRLDLAVMVKLYGNEGNPIEAARRYSPPQCTGVRVRVRAGAPRQDRITTSHVERLNLSVRTFNRRFTRLCLGWSRKLDNHRHSVALFVFAHNFLKVHSTLGCTPAFGARLTDHTWTPEEFLNFES